MQSRKCPKCDKSVVPVKSVKDGPLFDIYILSCPECKEELDSGVEKQNEEFGPFSPGDIPHPLDH